MEIRSLGVAVAITLAGTACSASPGEGTIVATVYPVAFAAEHLARPGAEVIDLTPPGGEAHDLELSLDARATLEDADMVIYLGNIGFQPQIEAAIDELDARIVNLGPSLDRVDGAVDPHFWLEPSYFNTIASSLAGEFCPAEDPCTEESVVRRQGFQSRLLQLTRRYGEGLHECRYDTLIVPHEAFAPLQLYGFDQFGLAGRAPEAEPTVDRLSEAEALVEGDRAGAVFFEARGESRDAAETLASDLGVTALPIDTLESRPPAGDYFTVMEDNLDSLREGMGCT